MNKELEVFCDLLQQELKGLFQENQSLKVLFEKTTKSYKGELEKYKGSIENIKNIKENIVKELTISKEIEKENIKDEYKRILQEKAKAFFEEKKHLEVERDRLKANLTKIENNFDLECQKIQTDAESVMKTSYSHRQLMKDSASSHKKPISNRQLIEKELMDRTFRRSEENRTISGNNDEKFEKLQSEVVRIEEKMQGNKLTSIEEKNKLNQEIKRLKDELITLKIKNGKLELENEFYRVKHKEIINELKRK